MQRLPDRRTLRRRFLAPATALAGLTSLLVLSACRKGGGDAGGGGGAGGAPAGGSTGGAAGGPAGGSASHAQAAVDLRSEPGSVYQVTYGDSTVLVDQAVVRQTLRSVSTNGNTFVFDPSPEIARLQPGSVLLVKGITMRKVLAVMPFEGKIAMLTTPAAITDAIKDGHIHFDHNVHFGSQSASRSAPASAMYASVLPDPAAMLAAGTRLASLLEPSRSALDAAFAPVAGGTCGSLKGWDFCVSGSAGGTQLQMHLGVKKVLAGYKAELTGDGHLDDFNMASDINIYGHDLKEFAWSTKNLNGVMNFSWDAAKNSPGPWTDEDRIPLPTSFELPFLLGDLPLTLSVTEALLVHPGFTGNGEMSQAHFRIQYSGAQSFTFHGGNLDDHGNVSGETEILETKGMSALGPHAFLAALAGPRIELRFEAASVLKEITQFLPSALAERAATAFAQSAVGQRMLNSPLAQAIQQALSIAKQSVDLALKSDAAAHLDFILSASLVESSLMSLVPCKQALGVLSVKVGANAQVFGQAIANVEKEVFHHGIKTGTLKGACSTDGGGPSSG